MNQQKIMQFFSLIKGKIWSFPMFVMSAFCGLVLSLAIVSTFRGGENTSLMASVSNLNNNQAITEHFSSHIVLDDEENFLTLTLGADLEKVDFIEGIIAFDGEKNLELTEHSLQKFAPGIYKFSLPFDWKTLNKWTIIARFEKNSAISVPMTLTDTQFISEGNRYNLSNEVK